MYTILTESSSILNYLDYFIRYPMSPFHKMISFEAIFLRRAFAYGGQRLFVNTNHNTFSETHLLFHTRKKIPTVTMWFLYYDKLPYLVNIKKLDMWKIG